MMTGNTLQSGKKGREPARLATVVNQTTIRRCRAGCAGIDTYLSRAREVLSVCKVISSTGFYPGTPGSGVYMFTVAANGAQEKRENMTIGHGTTKDETGRLLNDGGGLDG